ncbi:MAG: Dabb family protein [Nitrospinota bacterium]|nr:Dabb family protein [Nitrospinota bacterium]
MIRHIVLFKMKEGSTGEEKEKLMADLAGLKDSTDGLMLECEVASDVASTPTSYDVALNSLFESMEMVASYQVHPAHVKVLEYIKKVCGAISKIDYEV